jgi:DNA modification methylase
MLDARPLVVNKDNIILGGNMRFKASKEAGLKEVPVKIVDWSEEKQREFIIKDNVSGGDWDWDQLANEWDVEQLDEWGLDVPDFAGDVEVEEDEAPEVSDEPPVSKLGEVYQLGRHRVMCGDSTDAGSVAILMDGNKADMVFTDPPYGMKKEADGVLNDNLNYEKLLEFNKAWIPLTFDHMKEVGSWYCWGIDEPLMDIYSNILKPMAKEQKVTFRNLITWDKGHGQGQKAQEFRSYAVADEKCLFVMGGVQGFNNNANNYFEPWTPIVTYLDEQKNLMGWTIKDCKRIAGHSENSGSHWFDKSQWMMPTQETYESWQRAAKDDAFKKEYDEIKKEYDEIKKEYYSTRAYFDNTHDNMNNVWHFERTSNEERQGTGEHATPKPIALCSRAIKSSSRENELILDLFLGSGSTLIACEQTDRTCYGMELDPKYVDVIRKRYAKLVYPDKWEEEWESLTPPVE